MLPHLLMTPLHDSFPWGVEREENSSSKLRPRSLSLIFPGRTNTFNENEPPTPQAGNREAEAHRCGVLVGAR